MNKEFFVALDLLEKEKGISKEYMIEKIEAALLSACKKEYGASTLVRVAIDPVKEDVKVYIQKEVVEEVTNPQCEISLEEAKALSRRNTLGKLVETEVKTKNVRRLSAAAAKSVIIQGIREGERKVMQDAYESKRGEIITATVSKVFSDNGNVLLETDNGFATLIKSEQIPGETFEVGDKVKVFVTEVSKETRGPLVTLSRVHPGLVRRMFELEIPEIQDGIVMLEGVAREAGSRTKISVWSREEDVDAIGSCIGAYGSRIQSIVKELRGEKIDIVRYSEVPEEYVASALAPANVKSVEFLDERTCKVLVDPTQLSLAIGKEGQNARLAAKLTGAKIDIKSE
ncbi:MAG: transcription termination/antitermination protein NusA [Ruminococcaceae bacterium]|nr:transcription termination/antitermination protein NusA [Oscillospiraceae bacterium]